MRRNSFVFYTNWIEGIDGYPEEIQAEIIFALVKYCAYGIEPDLTKPHLKMAFMMSKASIDRNYKRYILRMNKDDQEDTDGEPMVDQRLTSGQPKVNQRNAKGEPQVNHGKCDNDNDNDNDNDTLSKDKSFSRDNIVAAKKRNSTKVKDNPPTVDEVKAYMAEKGYKSFTAEQFIGYYSSQDWNKSNGQPLTNWKGAVVTFAYSQYRSNVDYTEERKQTLTQDDTRYGKFNSWMFTDAPYIIAHCDKLLTEEEFDKLLTDIGGKRLKKAVTDIEGDKRRRERCAVLNTAIRGMMAQNVQRTNNNNAK